MKQSFLSKFSRSSGSAPTGWPSEDVVEIDASAVEMKKITSDLIKKLVMFLPPAGFSGEGFLETDNLSNGLLSSITGNKSVLSSPSFRSAPWNKSSSSDPVKKRDLSGIPVSQQLIMETSSAEQRKDTDVRRKVKVTSGTSFFVPKTIVNENHASAVDGCIKQAVTLEEDSDPGIAVGSAHGNFKKIPESVLARTCLESSERLSNLQPTLSHLFFGCGQAASQMACARLNWGNRVQSSVVAPLRRIVEATAPNGELVKSRRQAWRAGGELRSVSERAARAVAASTSCVGSSSAIDSSDELSPLVQSLSSPPLEATVYEHCKGSSRLQSSAKNSQIEKSLSDLSASSKSLITPLRSPTTVKSSLNCARPVTGTYIAGNGGSTSNIRDEDRSQKVLIRTAKATQLNAIKQDLEVEAQLMKEKALHELYNFESMSILECGKALVDLVEISASYHRTCIAILEELSPMLKEELDEQCPLPVFGRQLETHLQATGRRIAYPIKVCVRALNKPRVLAEEGLFRIAGSKKKVDTLQSALNTLRAENIIDQYDSFVIADVLKQYLRRLPEPLLTRKLFTEWTAVQHISGAHLQVAHLCQTASKLPEASRVNAGYLFRFIQELAKYADKNRMTATNLGIILGPTLLAPPITVDDEVQGDHESPKVNSIASKNHQNLTHHKSASPDTTLTKSNNVSESFTCAGSRGGVIELLITYADEVFPELIDDDSFELENEISENGDIFGDSETQLPAGVSESTFSKDSQNTEGRQYTPRLIPTTKLGRRAQRCRNELTRQGRSLPQHLKVKHSTSTSSTPRSLHTLQVFFTGRPQSSQSPSFLASPGPQLGIKSQQSPQSAPSTGSSRRSLTPVLSASERLRNAQTNLIGSARGSLPDTSAHTVARHREKTMQIYPEVPTSVDAVVVPHQPSLLGDCCGGSNAKSSTVGAKTSEDSSWKQSTARYGVYYGDSLSLDSNLTLEEVEQQPEQCQCEKRKQASFSHPRSDLQKRYQEWRRAMLDNSEHSEPLGNKFFHGDLYDTLFTLQTLNSVSGLDDFLTRIRSVYETRTAIKKATRVHACVGSPVVDSGQLASDTLKKATTQSKTILENTLYGTRRHSSSSMISNDAADTALPRPINPALQRHYMKSLTSPSCMKPRHVSIPLSPGAEKRTTSTLFGVDSSQYATNEPWDHKSTAQRTKKIRSSCATCLGFDESFVSSNVDARGRCPETVISNSNQLMTPTSARTSNTLPRTAAEANAIARTVPVIPPPTTDGMIAHFSNGNHKAESSAKPERTMSNIHSTTTSLPSLSATSRLSEDPSKTSIDCMDVTSMSNTFSHFTT